MKRVYPRKGVGVGGAGGRRRNYTRNDDNRLNLRWTECFVERRRFKFRTELLGRLLKLAPRRDSCAQRESTLLERKARARVVTTWMHDPHTYKALYHLRDFSSVRICADTAKSPGWVFINRGLPLCVRMRKDHIRGMSKIHVKSSVRRQHQNNTPCAAKKHTQKTTTPPKKNSNNKTKTKQQQLKTIILNK